MRRRSLFALLALAAVTVVAVAQLSSRPGGGPTFSSSIGPSPSTPLGTPVPTAAPQLTLLGPSYDPEVVRAPTGDPSQSKLWSVDDRWWGILVSSDGEARIHWLDLGHRVWRDTGVVVDERPDAYADALWDGERLFVATAGRNPAGKKDALRLMAYRYERQAALFVLEPDHPVELTSNGVRSPSLAQDSTGRLWVSFLVDDRLFVSHSEPDDHHRWVVPFQPQPLTTARASQAALVALPDAVTIVWTSPEDDGLFTASHIDGESPGRWTSERLDLAGLAGVSHQLTAQVVPGPAGPRVLVAIRTALDRGPNVNSGAPLILVVAIDPGGTARPSLFGRVLERHARPLLLVDVAGDRLYTIASGPVGRDGRAIYYKDTPLNDISFSPGLGAPLARALAPLEADYPTSTKQAVDGMSSLVVLGSDDGTGQYVTGILGLDDPPAAPPTPAPLEKGSNILLHETFEPWPIGTELANGWSVVVGGNARQAIVDRLPDRQGRGARLSVGRSGERVRLCRPFPPTATGDVRLSLELRIDDPGRSDTVVSVRGDGSDAASVRFDDAGSLAYYDGPVKVKTAEPFRAGRWYGLEVTLDVDERTYRWTLRDLDRGSAVASHSGIAWRSPDAGPLDELCLEAPAGRPGRGIHFNDVVVAR